MAIVEQSRTGRRVSLARRTLVGRAPGSALLLDEPGVSAEHAMISWSGDRWILRDLGSTNGTIVDGRKIEPGMRIELGERSELVFGGVEAWRVVDARGPIACAHQEGTGETRVAEHGLLALPSAAEPLVSVFEDEGGCWLIEAGEGTRRAEDQERIVADGIWVLSVPPPAPSGVVPTTRKLSGSGKVLGVLTLRFSVSQDDEYVELDLVMGDEITPLGARAHHYLLLTLSRARLADAAKGELPMAERGWLYVDDLAEMLKSDAQYINLAIFRARQQLAQAGVLNAGAIVERRLTTKQIRIGTDLLQVRTP